MSELYTVSFTTQALVRKFDAKGKETGTTRLDKPVTITALPYSTAMSYKFADNFKIERYVLEPRRASKGSGRDSSVGNGTKKVVGLRPGPADTAAVAAKVSRSKIADAAASGNLAAALNA